jgi:hypothetical protein
MIKLVRIALLGSALTCGAAGVASAQSVPFYHDPYYTFRIPGTNDFVSARGRAGYNLRAEQLLGTAPVTTKTAPAATSKPGHPALAQMNASVGG